MFQLEKNLNSFGGNDYQNITNKGECSTLICSCRITSVWHNVTFALPMLHDNKATVVNIQTFLDSDPPHKPHHLDGVIHKWANPIFVEIELSMLLNSVPSILSCV